MLTNEQLITHLNQKVLILRSLIDQIRELQKGISELPETLVPDHRCRLETAVDDTVTASEVTSLRYGIAYVSDTLRQIKEHQDNG